MTDPATESTAFGLPLKARKRTATLLYPTGEFLTVLEFFAVGNLYTAVLLRAVKGGVNLPLTKISAIFKVPLSLFLLTQFFITHLTLPYRPVDYSGSLTLLPVRYCKGELGK